MTVAGSPAGTLPVPVAQYSSTLSPCVTGKTPAMVPPAQRQPSPAEMVRDGMAEKVVYTQPVSGYESESCLRINIAGIVGAGRWVGVAMLEKVVVGATVCRTGLAIVAAMATARIASKARVISVESKSIFWTKMAEKN